VKIRLIIISFALLAFLTASVGGYLYYHSMIGSAVMELNQEAKTRTDDLANRIALYFSGHERMAAALAGMKEVQRVMVNRQADTMEKANAVLDHFQRSLDVNACYLISSSGVTIASSNRNSSESFVGKNFGFRPYFKQSMEGKSAVYLALGVISGKRGVYYSYPIYTGGQHAPAGVAVIKTSVDYLDRELHPHDDGVMVLSDARGMIFVSSRTDWLYHALWKLSSQTLSEISETRQFGKGPFSWTGLELTSGQYAVDALGKRYRIHRASLDNLPGWEVMYAQDHEIAAQKESRLVFRKLGFGILLVCIAIGFTSFILYRIATHEIAKRKEIEDEFRSISHRFQAIINASPLPITIVDAEGKASLWNPAAEQVFGWTGREVTDNSLPIVPAERQDEFIDFLARIFKGNAFKSVETQRMRKDGTLIDVALSAAPVHNADGVITAAMEIFEDITERKKAEEKLWFLAAIIQNLPEAVCAIDTQNAVVAWNSGAERLLGYETEEILGKSIALIIPPELVQPELDHCLTKLNTDGCFSGYETVRLTKSGRRIPVELTGVVIRDKANAIKNYASIMVDLTDRKKAEEERLKGHMLESIGILAGGIAHDFNNLLSVIIGNIAVAKMQAQPGDKAFSRLDDAENVCEIAAELSKRLITFATGGDPVRKPAPLPKLLRDAVALKLNDTDIHAVFDLPDDLSLVAIDEGQMKQVFVNLVINAREAMPKGGTLTISGENIHISAQDTFPMREGDYVKIVVRDTGSGIPAESIAKIFDPYYSTKDTYSQKGLGLGLAVCYSIIRKHDGLITAESQVGEGTTFSIYLNAVKNG